MVRLCLTLFIEAGLDIDLHMPVPLNVMIVETVHTLKYVPLIGLDPLLIQPRKHATQHYLRRIREI